jgi:hypothetical protein
VVPPVDLVLVRETLEGFHADRIMAQGPGEVLPEPGLALAFRKITAIDGVAGRAAPAILNFTDVAGGATGAFLPTGRPSGRFDGGEATCTDGAMPVVIARAADLGLSGPEPAAELDAEAAFLARIGGSGGRPAAPRGRATGAGRGDGAGPGPGRAASARRP